MGWRWPAQTCTGHGSCPSAVVGLLTVLNCAALWTSFLEPSTWRRLEGSFSSSRIPHLGLPVKYCLTQYHKIPGPCPQSRQLTLPFNLFSREGTPSLFFLLPPLSVLCWSLAGTMSSWLRRVLLFIFLEVKAEDSMTSLPLPVETNREKGLLLTAIHSGQKQDLFFSK